MDPLDQMLPMLASSVRLLAAIGAQASSAPASIVDRAGGDRGAF